VRTVFIDPIGHLLGEHDRAACRGLAARGHIVTLVTNAMYPFAADQEPFDTRLLYGHAVGDRPAWVRALNFGLFFPRIVWLVLRERVDNAVLYFTIKPSADRWLVRLLRAMGVRTILSAHDVLPIDHAEAERPAYGAMYRAAREFLTFSDYARNELIETFGIPPERVHAYPFGLAETVDMTDPALRARFRSQLALANDEFTLLCFGQIKGNKDLDTLLNAVAGIDSNRNVRLLVVGRPRVQGHERFPDLADRLGVTRRYIDILRKHPDANRRLPPPFKIGRATFWRAEDVNAWLAQQAERNAA